MAKNDTATPLENSRKALLQLEEEIKRLEQRRNSALLNSEPASAVRKIDDQINSTAHAIKTEQDRIGLLDAELKRQREQERLKDKLAQIEQVDHKFAERDVLGKRAEAAMKELDAAYRGLFLISRELRDLWPWKMVDMAPTVLSETEIERVIAAEYWRIGGRPVPTGGAMPPADGPSLRIPIAWPHDGLQHEKGSGLALADIYLRLGAPMLGTHAQNRSGGFHLEPAIEEMCGYMKRDCFSIASHMSELAEEILNYHRDEDYKIVRLRDDLISAGRYALMMRRSGKPLEACEEYGRAPGVAGPDLYDPRPRRDRSHEQQVTKNVDFNVFTGEPY